MLRVSIDRGGTKIEGIALDGSRTRAAGKHGCGERGGTPGAPSLGATIIPLDDSRLNN